MTLWRREGLSNHWLDPTRRVSLTLGSHNMGVTVPPMHKPNPALFRIKALTGSQLAMSSLDMMLQWVNEYFELGLAEDDVSWRRIRNAQSRTNPAWLETRQILSETWDSAWYFDVRTYRNFSHRSFLHLQTLIPREPGKIIVAMEAARDNAPMCADIREELPKYIEAMRLLGGRVFFPKGHSDKAA
ncbi:MAG: hypothetical protein ACREQW_19960 [Candidatus Binatia bacterium]